MWRSRSSSLTADDSPRREVHLRFSVRGLPETVRRAVLRLHASAGTEDGLEVYATQGGWSESSVTWTTRPARVGAALEGSPVISTGVYVDYDVTEWVRGDGEYTLGLYAVAGDGVTFHSREATAPMRRPQLIVWTGAPKEASTDAGLTRTEFFSRGIGAAHDTYAAQDLPDEKFRTRATLTVDAEARGELPALRRDAGHRAGSPRAAAPVLAGRHRERTPVVPGGAVRRGDDGLEPPAGGDGPPHRGPGRRRP